jgi:hypothetical protein
VNAPSTPRDTWNAPDERGQRQCAPSLQTPGPIIDLLDQGCDLAFHVCQWGAGF